MYEVLAHVRSQRVESERRTAKQDAEGVVPVKLSRTKDACTVQCEVDDSEMPRLKRKERVVFGYLDEKEELKWEYTPAVVAEVARCTVYLLDGWPTHERWPSQCFMKLWVNEGEYLGLHANIQVIFETPSWVRSVLCEPLTPKECAERCTAPSSADSTLEDLRRVWAPHLSIRTACGLCRRRACHFEC